MSKLVIDFPEYEKGKLHWLSWVEKNPEKVKAIRERYRKKWLKKNAAQLIKKIGEGHAAN